MARAAGGAVAAGLLALLTACGLGSESTSAPAIPESPAATTRQQTVVAATVTLSEAGCGLTEGDPVEPGAPFEIEVMNDTQSDSGFDLYLLKDDATYEDWVSFHHTVQESFESEEEVSGSAADLASPIHLMEAVAAGDSSVLTEASAQAGEYVLQCWTFVSEDETRVTTAGPLEVAASS